MGESETSLEESIVGAGDPDGKPPKGCVTAIVGFLSGVTMIIAVVVKFSVLGAAALAGIAHCLLALSAFGWIIRAAIRARIGYLRRIRVEGVSSWALLLTSLADAAFALVWLGVAILLLVHAADPLATGVATVIICLTSFALALATHLAAQAAGRPRASEWVRARYRGSLEPGKTTWIGWILIKVIDGPSPEALLSTYVGGTMVVLLLVILLTASAAVSESEKSESETTPTVSVSPPSKTSKPGGGAPTQNPEAVAQLRAGTATNRGTKEVRATSKAVRFFCFPVKVNTHRAPPRRSTQQMTFFCSIVVEGQLTNEFVVLVPPQGH